MTASTSAVGVKTSGSSAASASSPLASAFVASVPGASTVAGTGVVQTGPAAPAGLLGDEHTATPAHPSSESTPAIQLPVPAPPIEHLAPVSPVVSPQAAAQAAPLQQQLARPMIRLASAENGAHTLVVRVAPDDLGPVTIQAHISDAGVKIELFAPNEAGREAIKQILPELRRDLTSTDGSVSVSDQNAPSADSDERARQPRAAPQDGGSRTARDLPDVSTLSPLSGSSAYALDVLA
jgi:flagellar hook-length control protein FliK